MIWLNRCTAIVAAWTIFTAGPGVADTCFGSNVDISGGVSAEKAQLCGFVKSTLESLSDCGLPQKGPISIGVYPGPISGDPHCLGSCDGENAIKVLEAAAMYQALDTHSPLRDLPEDELFQSILAHELAHVLMLQNRRGFASRTNAEHEYVSYVAQLLALSPEGRAGLIESIPAPNGSILLSHLNDTLLWFAPLHFGIRSYQHYVEQEDGCAFIGRVVEGGIDFTVGNPICIRPPCD